MPLPAFGANCWIWESPVTTEVIASLAPRLNDWGFDLMEMPLEVPEDWEPNEVRRILDANGLLASVCVAMAPGRDLSTADTSVIRSTQDYLRQSIEAAAIVGSQTIAGPIYSPTGQTGLISPAERHESITRIAENLRPLLDEGEQAGIGIAIEPLNRFETSLFNTVEQTLELIEATDHPSLGLLLDTFHMNIEERDPAAAIRLAGDRLLHFHACGNNRGAPGPGAIPWPAIRDALHNINYSGNIVIESFTSANETIAAAAAIWRPLALSQDEIATEGLVFLKELFSGRYTSTSDLVLADRITSNPEVMLGKPVIRGTRIPVYIIVGMIESGETPESLVDAYTNLTLEDIAAALAFENDERDRTVIKDL